METRLALAALAEGAITKAMLGETAIIVIRMGDGVHALEATCPHAGAPLEQGAVCNGRLICPWHKGTLRRATVALLSVGLLISTSLERSHLAVCSSSAFRQIGQEFRLVPDRHGGHDASVHVGWAIPGLPNCAPPVRTTDGCRSGCVSVDHEPGPGWT